MAMNLARSHQLEQLTGAQKAAILCMVLGSESASLITRGSPRPSATMSTLVS